LSNDLPTLYPGYKISKKLNSNLFYDSHEIYTETINQFFPKKNPFFKSLIFNFLIFFMRRHGIKIEKKIFPKLYQFITVNESLLKYFNSKYRIAKGLVVMNVPRDSDAISSVERIDYYSMFDWLKTDIILIYQGGLNEGRGLYLLVESFSKLPKNYKLVILGDGVLRKSLMEKAEQLNLNNSIQFINSVALSELPKYTKGATIGINLLESFNLSKKLASPNKLFEYIHAGIPVIASHSVENKIVLDKFNIGILTENTTEKITQAIQNMTEQAILKYKSNTIEARAHYKWENQEGNILKSMK
jgi:glycosyltransferase involved in cell wall biosynthesis